MIYDLRFTIACGCAGRVENPRQLLGFGVQRLQALRGQQSRSFRDFDPERRFVGLFQDRGDLVDEVRTRFTRSAAL